MGYDYDVLVIGSGFGGSVTALRLTPASGASNRGMGIRGSGSHRTAALVTRQQGDVDGGLQ